MSLSHCGLFLLALSTVSNRTDKNSYGAFVLCSIFSHLSLCCFFFFLFKLFLSSVGLSVLNIVILLFLKKKL